MSKTTISQALMEFDKKYITPDTEFILTIRDIARMYKTVQRRENENLALRAKIAILELEVEHNKTRPERLIYG